jgi:prolyl oligopeptidase
MSENSMSENSSRLNYPVSHQVNIVDNYHGVEVADPYRWLEDTQSEETQAWIASQNQLTFSYLAEIPSRSDIKQRLTQVWDYEKYGLPFKQGDQYFYFKNDGLQNQNVLYVLPDLEATPRALIDPNLWSDDGTISLSGISISEDGKLLAYGYSVAGSDWQEWRVIDVATAQYLPDVIKWIKFSGVTWTHDCQGFFYARYEIPNTAETFTATHYLQRVYYHRLGTDQAEDLLIYEKPDQKEWSYYCHITEDGRYLLLMVWQSTDRKNLVFYKDLTIADAPIVELINEFEAEYTFIGNDDNLFWFLTDLDAPKKRLISIDISKPPVFPLGKMPHQQGWSQVIAESENTLQGISLINHQFVAFYLRDAHTEIKIFDLQGNFIRPVELPGLGSANGFGGKSTDTETFYSYTSFTVPPTIYRYNMVTGESNIFREPAVNFDPDLYETVQVFYPSKDGTKIPMFITHKKGLQLDGSHPCILYGYGGFSISLTPAFSVSRIVWLEMGGIYAIANLRGGGEYGEAWHQAGIKANKQNTFDDFIGAAEWLIQAKYTNSSRLAIQGGSNGGLLVGACMIQRPELFAAALPAVGVMDMLRFHKFTIGWAWMSDYGSPDDPKDFAYIYQYSPLHNLQEGIAYPATLVITADTDDRVVPAHSFKFAAALQKAHAGEQPVLIRIETKAGHGGGKPTTKIIEEVTDQFAFLYRVLAIAPKIQLNSQV